MYDLVSQNSAALSNFSELTITVVRFLKSQETNFFIFEIILLLQKMQLREESYRDVNSKKKSFIDNFFSKP